MACVVSKIRYFHLVAAPFFSSAVVVLVLLLSLSSDGIQSCLNLGLLLLVSYTLYFWKPVLSEY